MSQIVFIHRGGPEMASYRYRALLPAHELNKLNGYQVTINEGEADTVIFSKCTEADIALAKDVKAQGAKVLVDIGDDHLTHPMIGPIYTQMMQLADRLVTPTHEMAERLYRVTGKSPVVIPDPFEYPEALPHAEGNKLLWFGHERNLKTLRRFLAYTKAWDFAAITGPREHPGMLRWSHETVLFKLAESNVVLIPTNKGEEYKSANRLLNAVRAGCFVVAGDAPAHREFQSMLWVGDVKHGLDWARAFPDRLNALVAQAQAHIAVKYHPKRIAELWAQVLG